jgi:hypothetical protein
MCKNLGTEITDICRKKSVLLVAGWPPGITF